MGHIYTDINSSGTSYSVSDVDFKCYNWNDSIGNSLKSKVSSVPSSFNIEQEKVWKHASKLLEVDSKYVKYDSRLIEIEGLTVK